MSFKDVNPVINAYMQKSEMHMQDGIMFVVLSIKTPFHTMSKQMQDYRKYGLSSLSMCGDSRSRHLSTCWRTVRICTDD